MSDGLSYTLMLLTFPQPPFIQWFCFNFFLQWRKSENKELYCSAVIFITDIKETNKGVLNETFNILIIITVSEG